MRIELIAMLDDNYGYLVIDESTREAAVIDPVEPAKVKAAVDAADATVTHILTTHKHWDHAGGNKGMVALIPAVNVVGGVEDDVEACTLHVKDGDTLKVGGIEVRCLHTPGHTKGHTSYYCKHGDGPGAVFTGDCLFVGGAGKFFEGIGDDMHLALNERLAKLPPDTLVYCGHEYTLANYRFALSLEPDNEKLRSENLRAQEQRSAGRPTVPSTIARELETNPFMRVDSLAILKACPLGAQATPPDVLQWVRDAKNFFRG